MTDTIADIILVFIHSSLPLLNQDLGQCHLEIQFLHCSYMELNREIQNIRRFISVCELVWAFWCSC